MYVVFKQITDDIVVCKCVMVVVVCKRKDLILSDKTVRLCGSVYD